MTPAERQEEIISDYLLIEDSFERFQLIVETAGSPSADYPEIDRNDGHLVPGCVSRVWLSVRETEEGVEIHIDSEAPALKGIAGLISRIYSGGSNEQIREVELDFIERLDMERHITPTRLRGISNIRNGILAALG